ncbi:type I glyceraldehyde-3-phosphate dehydrogenase [Arenicella xantha]|uniref:Glyceraldehyde-3-phosphate dehydrogenase n=1 Tax=Arenicella xantha TaxID=644221 RepID=A0A395JNB9_9GAMM|nr:type I glyceraldehyde-3-phosphate dehydrogenase [Arenicella xantha]RBP53151.1 glyceraldehyde 3-phosphate dehydrogenase [Arenicella xantha]
MINIAINGFGRIGRNILRAVYERGLDKQFNIVAINDLASTEANAHLLQYDTTHGRFNQIVSFTEDSISVDGKVIPAFMQRDPANLPWGDLDVDIVLECTGFFRTRELASKHLTAGAKKVLVSAPGKGLDATVVFGVNDSEIGPNSQLISNASCTTNCLAHVASAMHSSIGIVSGLANTVHAYTNTQNLLDSYHKDKRRGRAASYSMIPTSTGSAKAIGQVIPDLDGKLDAVAVRVPTINVSLLDLTFLATRKTSLQEIADIFEVYKEGRSGVFNVSNVPLVSIDFNHDPNSCVVDIEQTRINGQLVKVQAWYDNEWGFSNRMLDTASRMQQ